MPGVTEVNVHGGFYKSFEVLIDPDRLAAHNVALGELFDALTRNNSSTGGGYVVHHGEQRFIRGQSLLKNITDIENVTVRQRNDGVPLLVRDLATVSTAPLTRQGAVTRDGRGEAVTGMVMMLLGENSRTVVHRAKEELAKIEKTLPPGVSLEVIYDRASLIERTLNTVLHNLVEGGVLVIVVLLVLLGSVRAGLIVALAIPLSMLFATNVMAATGITASLMSLGAIDFGLIRRQLGDHGGKLHSAHLPRRGNCTPRCNRSRGGRRSSQADDVRRVDYRGRLPAYSCAPRDRGKVVSAPWRSPCCLRWPARSSSR